MTLSTIRLVPKDWDDAATQNPPPKLPQDRVAAHVRRAIVHARGFLVAQQRSDGQWEGQIEASSLLESQYILLLAWLGEADSPRAQAAARWIVRTQLADGGWARYPGGPLDISASVLAYFALKLTGHEPHTDCMQRAREAILRAGGAEGVNSLARYYLALLGQICYDQCPPVPPELLALKRRLASQPLLAPLSVIWSLKPVLQLAATSGIRELFIKRPEEWSAPESVLGNRRILSRLFGRFGHTPFRKLALRCAERELTQPEGSALTLLWNLIALKALEHADQSPAVRCCQQRLDAFLVEDENVLRVQPCKLPIEDTTLAMQALAESGHDLDDELSRAAQWLLEQSLDVGVFRQNPALCTTLCSQFTSGTGQHRSPISLQLAGSAQECEARSTVSLLEQATATLQRAEQALLTSRDAQKTPDLAGSQLEALAALGRRLDDTAVAREVETLRQKQRADGSWAADRGFSIDATRQALIGLAAVGMSQEDPLIAAAVNWLLSHQQACGGWGESPECCEDTRLRCHGPVTASQTGSALLALIAAGRAQHQAVLRGVRFLVSEQSDEGDWHEPEFTCHDASIGYHRREVRRVCLPLLALSRWMVAVDGDAPADGCS